jgi:hypothetical protein
VRRAIDEAKPGPDRELARSEPRRKGVAVELFIEYGKEL